MRTTLTSRISAPLLAILALALATLGAASLAGGLYCYTQPDPGAGCAVLTVLVPLIAFPFAAALGIFAAAQSGWLARRVSGDETGADNKGAPDGAPSNDDDYTSPLQRDAVSGSGSGNG